MESENKERAGELIANRESGAAYLWFSLEGLTGYGHEIGLALRPACSLLGVTCSHGEVDVKGMFGKSERRKQIAT